MGHFRGIDGALQSKKPVQTFVFIQKPRLSPPRHQDTKKILKILFREPRGILLFLVPWCLGGEQIFQKAFWC
jgi:hypothetical protein